MIKILIAMCILVLLFFTNKEGMAEDVEIETAIQCMRSAYKDPRMEKTQKLALDDAIRYAIDIKTNKNIGVI